MVDNTMRASAVGIDFGTTNSAVAVVGEDGQVTSLSWPSASGDVGVFRTALAVWSEGRAPRAVVRTAGGPQALEHALAGSGHGRFVQSIKTYLGSRAFTETRLYGQRFTIEDLVATFLGHLVPDREALLAGAARRGGGPASRLCRRQSRRGPGGDAAWRLLRPGRLRHRRPRL